MKDNYGYGYGYMDIWINAFSPIKYGECLIINIYLQLI